MDARFARRLLPREKLLWIFWLAEQIVIFSPLHCISYLAKKADALKEHLRYRLLLAGGSLDKKRIGNKRQNSWRPPEPFNMFPVYPAKFLLIENCASLLYLIEVKFAYQFLQSEHFLLPPGIPTEQREIIDKRLGKISPIAVFSDGNGAMAFGELAFVRGEDKRNVNVHWSWKTKGFLKQNLPRRVGNVVFATDDVRYAHLIIVHDNR